MFFRNATLFSFPRSLDFTDLGRFLFEEPLKPVGPLELASAGFIRPFGADGAMVEEVGTAILITLGTEEKILPSAVVAKLLGERLAEIEEKEGRKPGGRARKRIKDDLIHELLPKAFVRPGRVNAIIDTSLGLLIVDTSSHRVGEMVVSYLRAALGSFPALPVNATIAPRALLTGYVADTLPAGIELGEECELKDGMDGGATARVGNTDLRGEEVLAHLESGKQVTRLALTVEDRISVVLGEDLVLRKLKLTDVVMDEAEGRDDAVSIAHANLALFSGELRRLLTRLSKELALTDAT